MKIYIIFELFYRSHLSHLCSRFRQARERQYLATGRIPTRCLYSISENNPLSPFRGMVVPCQRKIIWAVCTILFMKKVCSLLR